MFAGTGSFLSRVYMGQCANSANSKCSVAAFETWIELNIIQLIAVNKNTQTVSQLFSVANKRFNLTGNTILLTRVGYYVL